jgi:membrane associated rhomboid family serine protease
MLAAVKDLGHRLLVLWYRLLGNTPTQAEWRARRASERPAETGRQVRAHVDRASDRRFHCACGQLLVAGDRVCPRCGRRQYLPYGVRRVLRALGLVVPEAVPGTILVMALMIIGYAFEVRAGGGNVLSPVGGGTDLLDLGAAYAALTLGPQPWRAFTYTMLHGNLLHLVFNGLALVQVGPLVENRFGTGRFLFAWLLGGAAAVTGPPLLGIEKAAPVVGASGAIFTLIGMAMVRGHLDGDARGRLIRDVMIRWAVYTTIFGFAVRSVANGAHFGGLVAGAVLCFVLPPPDGRPGRARLGPLLGTLGVAGMSAGLGAFIAWRASGALPPRSVSPGLAIEWSVDRARSHGPESALDDRGRELLSRGRDLAHRDPESPEVRAFLADVQAYVRERSAGPALVLLATLQDGADPALGRVYNELAEPLLRAARGP